MDEPWKIIVAFASLLIVVVGSIAGFLHWHFKTFNGLKDELTDLKVKIAELKAKDELQQATIDRLPELYPALNAIVSHLTSKKSK